MTSPIHGFHAMRESHLRITRCWIGLTQLVVEVVRDVLLPGLRSERARVLEEAAEEAMTKGPMSASRIAAWLRRKAEEERRRV